MRSAVIFAVALTALRRVHARDGDSVGGREVPPRTTSPGCARGLAHVLSLLTAAAARTPWRVVACACPDSISAPARTRP